MLKIKFSYGGIFSENDKNKGILVQVYDSESRKDGKHISASSVFNANMLNKLSEKKIKALLLSLQGSIEACNKEVSERIKNEM